MARKTSEAMGWRSFIRWMYFPQRRSSIKEVFVRMGSSSLRRFRDVVRRKFETLKCKMSLKQCGQNDYKRGWQQEYTGSRIILVSGPMNGSRNGSGLFVKCHARLKMLEIELGCWDNWKNYNDRENLLALFIA